MTKKQKRGKIMGTEFKDEIERLIDGRSQAYTDISDAIWGFAEPRFQERESSRIQQEYLRSRGFAIRADLAGEETAFIAEYGSGKPVIAFLGEFDRSRTRRSDAPLREKKTAMAAATISWEQPLRQRQTP